MRVNLRVSFVSVLLLMTLLAGWWKLEQLEAGLRKMLGWQHTVKTEASSAGDWKVMHTPGGLLEVARIKAYERFTRSDRKAWGPLNFGTTVSEIEVPALFHYQIEMAKEWPIECGPQVCVVRAGTPTPAFPAGIYTDEVKKRTKSGWARFNKHDNLSELERSVADQLALRASSDRNREAAMAEGRKTVKEFVRTWVLKEPNMGRQAQLRIVVLYPGETVETIANDL